MSGMRTGPSRISKPYQTKHVDIVREVVDHRRARRVRLDNLLRDPKVVPRFVPDLRGSSYGLPNRGIQGGYREGARSCRRLLTCVLKQLECSAVYHRL